MKETTPKPRNVAEALRLAGGQQNLLDRAITWFDPARGIQRLKSRTQLAMAGAYSGASRSKRSLSSWRPKQGSADADLLPDLPDLRDRSRDLLRNTPLAAGAINTAATNVVGTGLMLKSQVERETLGWSEEQAGEWQNKVEREWALWAESTWCDATRTQSFYGLQDLAFRSALENGDCFALLPFIPRKGAIYDLRVQLIEADRVTNKDGKRDTRTMAGGVEMDEAGAPLRYHVLNRHPGDIDGAVRAWTAYEAFGTRTGRRNVLHLYTKLRIGQTRGVPYLSPVVEILKQLSRYTESEVFAAVLSSMIAIVFKSDSNGPSPLESAVEGVTPGTSGDQAASGWDGTLTPGLTVDLGVNESVTSMSSTRPNTSFDPFVQALLRQVGVALEIPFEVLVKHFTASYSAARAALLEAWKFFRKRRAWLAESFCQPVYEAWLEEAVAMGRISAPGFFADPAYRAAYCGAAWHGDGPGMLNPKDEGEAIKTRIEIGLTTLDEEIAQYDGGRFEKKVEQRGREHAMQKERDLLPKSPSPQPSSPAGEGDESKDKGEKPEQQDGEEKNAGAVHIHLPEAMLHTVKREDSALLAGLQDVTRSVADSGIKAAEANKQTAVAISTLAAAVGKGNATVKDAIEATRETTKMLVGQQEKQAGAVIQAQRDTAEGLRQMAAATNRSTAIAEKPSKPVYDKQGTLIGVMKVDNLKDSA
jgi:lambda family phage portal protein